MIFFWPKVYGPLGKTPYIYPRYQVWGVTDLNFDLAYYHPPLMGDFVLTFHLIFWVILSDFDSSEKLNECSSETRRQL